MKWVKIGQIEQYISISPQTIRKLKKDGILKDGKHYVKNQHISHTLYNVEALEKWLLQEPISQPSKIQNLLKQKDW